MITIKVYVTEADHEIIKRAAKAARRSVSSYVAIAATERAQADAASVAAAKVERSCFTCNHNRGAVCHHPASDLDMAIDQYGVDAGCIANNGGMPTNRNVRCPGWAAKEPA